jgi:hypothetical protein
MVMTKFYHLHLPKTGGTSLSSYFKKNGIPCGGGFGKHSPFLKHSIPKDSVVITILRCPIKHAVSFYACNLRPNFGPKNPKPGTPKWLAQKHTFSEWIRIPPKQFPPCPAGPLGWGSYVAFFGNGPNDLEGAIANLKSIDHVLDTSHLPKQFNNRVAAKYGIPPFKIHENRSPSIEISQDDIEYIKKQKEDDLEICRMFGIEISE